MDIFLSSLSYGIKDIPNSKKEIFYLLCSLGALDKDDVYKLKRGYFIGYVVTSRKGFHFLRLLKSTKRDPKIINSKGLIGGDLILAKISSNQLLSLFSIQTPFLRSF